MTPNEVVISPFARDDSDVIKPVVQSYSLEDGSLRWSTSLPFPLAKDSNVLRNYDTANMLITSKSVYISAVRFAGSPILRTFVLNRSDGSIQMEHTGYTTIVMNDAMFGFKFTDSNSARSVLWAESN
jgi:hypothetical protein